MSVNPTMPKEMNHSTFELRLSELEADFKNHKELSKTVENLSNELNEMKTQLVKKILLKDKIFIILSNAYLEKVLN